MCVSKKTERGKFLEDFPTNEKLEVKSKSKPYKFQNENNTHNLVKNQRKEKNTFYLYQLMWLYRALFDWNFRIFILFLLSY